MNEQEFGAKIKARREELGLQQKEVAEALGIDQGKVSLIEKGIRRVDSVKELPILAKLFQYPVSWFYEDIELTKETTPIEGLINQYFPNVEFTDFEIRRIAQFMEPVLQSYVKTDPELSKKIMGS